MSSYSVKFAYAWKGDWSSATRYIKDDLVRYEGSVYRAIIASEGQTPAEGTYWTLFVAGGLEIADALSVTSYGATGDGTTNDTAAITAALTAAAGGLLVFPEGTYAVTELTISQAVRIIGYGATLVPLTQTAAQAIVKVTTSDVVIENLAFDGQNKNCRGVNAVGTAGTPIERVTLKGCTLKNFGASGARFEYVHYALATDVFITETARDAAADEAGLFFTNCKYGVVKGVRVKDAHMKGVAAIYSEAFVYDDIVTNGMTQTTDAGNAQGMGLYVGRECRQFQVSNCVSLDNYETAFKVSQYAQDVNIANCHLEGGTTAYGLMLQGCYNVDVANCTIIGVAALAAIKIVKHSGASDFAHDITIRGCQVRCATENSKIEVDPGNYNIVFANNIIDGLAVNAIGSATDYITGFVFEGNKLDRGSQQVNALRVDYAKKVNIASNIVDNDTATFTDVAVSAINVLRSESVRITGNYAKEPCRAAASGGIYCFEVVDLIAANNETALCNRGVYLVTCTDANVSHNNSHDNAETGIYVNGGTNALILDNFVSSNTTTGIVANIGSLRGNKLHSNGTPLDLSGSAHVEVFNVRDFGAMGDGATNDQAAIQAAINAAKTEGGGVVFFPDGDYVLNSAVQYSVAVDTSAELVLRGNGPNSKLIAGDHINLIELTATETAGINLRRIVVEGLNFNMNNKRGNCIKGQILAYCFIRNCMFAGHANDAAASEASVLLRNCSQVVVSNNLFVHNPNSASAYGGAGVEIRNTAYAAGLDDFQTKHVITSNTFGEQLKYGVLINDDVGAASGGNTITGNNFYYIYSEAIKVINSDRNTIAGNIFDTAGKTNSTAGILLDSSSDNAITGNSFRDAGVPGAIKLDGQATVAEDCANNLISDNVFTDPAGTGQYAVNISDANSTSTRVVDNVFSGSWAISTINDINPNSSRIENQVGLQLAFRTVGNITAAAEDTTPSVSAANIINLQASTVYTMFDDGKEGQYLFVRGAAGARLVGSATLRLAGGGDFAMADANDTVLFQYFSSSWWEVARNIMVPFERGTAAPSSGTYVKGSIRLNTGVSTSGPLGWVCTVAGTPGTWVAFGAVGLSAALQATATLDWGSIGAQAAADKTVAVTGAAVGDIVAASPNTTLEAGLAFNAWVSAADTVTIRLHNYSAGAIDPASRSWKVAVLK